jgi:tRNA threonylcarbamoyladenosine biosynthesis protein TsaB
MKLLAFDTSTRWLTVACVDGDTLAERRELAEQAHSQRIVPLIDAVLQEAGVELAQLDAVAFGAGPGTFTGVRIACGVAQGLALGAGLRVVAVSTLEAIAQSSQRERVIACLDARMREVYVGFYRREADRWIVEREPAVLHPDDVAALPGAWDGAGDGFAAYPALTQRLGLRHVDAAVVPEARAIAALAAPRVAAGDTVSAADALPLYVRHRVALTTAERDAGLRL